MRVKYRRRFRAFWREEMPPFLRSLGVLLLLGLGDRGAVRGRRHHRRRAAVRAAVRQPVHVQAARARARARRAADGAERPVPGDEHRPGRGHGRPARQQGRVHGAALRRGRHVLPRHGDGARAAGGGGRGAPLRRPAARPRQGRRAGRGAAQGQRARREEWEFIRQHPEKGAEVLSHLAAYQEVADIVRFHHERLDGSGYPNGITQRRDPRAQQGPRRRRQLPRHDVGPARTAARAVPSRRSRSCA